MLRTAIQLGLAARSCPTRTALLIMRAAAHGDLHVAHSSSSSYMCRTPSTPLPSPSSPTLLSSSQPTVAHSINVAQPLGTLSSLSLEWRCATEGDLSLSAARSSSSSSSSSSLTRGVSRASYQSLKGRLGGACHTRVRRGAAAAAATRQSWETYSSGVAQPRRGRRRGRQQMSQPTVAQPINVAQPTRGIVAMAKENLLEPIADTHSEHQMKLMFEDECILVDENDNVIGHDSKYNCHLMERIDGDNLLHRAFSVFLFNTKNELLLQQRAGTKVTFPLAWTNTCCSHPLYRESELITEKNLGVRNAAQRKLLDELGIKPEQLPVDKFTILGRIHYKAPSHGKWGEHEVDYLLVMRRDVDLEPNPEEVASVQYVNRAALREIVRKADAGEDGITLSPWFRLLVDTFLFKWWDRLEEGTLESIIDLDNIHRF